MTFRGKHFDSATALRYNAVHNEYIVNANSSMGHVIDSLLELPSSICIRWLHGYPSLISEFAHELLKRDKNEIEKVRSRLIGILLGSEFPAPMYCSIIKSVLSNNLVSWYGHSEMAVLAKEIAEGVYQTLPSYGFAEAIPTQDGRSHRLICTSYHNRVHPFIRYDTGDLIEPVSQIGGVLTFKVNEGRIGDFINDAHGKRHSLTAIIFGRHHEAFNLLQHLQVREDAPGKITLVITPTSMSITDEDLRQRFNLNDLPFQWCIERVSEPVRTAAGKVTLKI